MMRLSLDNYNLRRARRDVSRLGNALENKIAAYKRAQAGAADAEAGGQTSEQFGATPSAENTSIEHPRRKAEEAEAHHLREIEAVVDQLDQYGSLTSQYRNQANHNLTVLEGGRSRLHGREPKRHYDHAAASMRHEIGDCGSILNTIQKYLEESGKTLNYGSGSPTLARIYAPMAAVERWKNFSAGRSSDYTQQTISMLEMYAKGDGGKAPAPPRPGLGGAHSRAQQDLPAKLNSGHAYARLPQVRQYVIPLPDNFRHLRPGANTSDDVGGRYPVNPRGDAYES